MIHLTDVAPSFCPGCGDAKTWDGFAQQDWVAGCSMRCRCGAWYQRVPTADLVEAADRHGDLKQWADQTEEDAQ